MVGPKKQDFWPRINILKGKLFEKIQLMNYAEVCPIFDELIFLVGIF